MITSTLNLEDQAKLCLNYLCGNMDSKRGGLPYFWTFFRPDPPEIRHAWPDYGDITGRFVDAFILAHQMTGEEKGQKEEERLKELLLSFFSENDGLSYRPYTAWSKHDALMFDQGRVLMALTTWYLQTGEERVKKAMEKMVDGLWNIAYKKGDYCYYPYHVYPPGGWSKDYHDGLDIAHQADPCYDGGQFIPSLVRFYEATGSESALNLARNLVHWNVYHAEVFDLKKGIFKGHLHSRMATVTGVIRYALVTKNSQLIEWAKRVYDYALSVSGSFGWYAENTEEEGCETCSICDMIDGGILLTRAGYPEYWNVVERTARNHLIESQLRDIDWISSSKHKKDTEESSFQNVAERMKGAFAGWSAPNDFIGRVSNLDNPYKLMNCCGPAGLHALYLVWDNVVTKNEEGVWINLSLNHESPWLRINSYRPYSGKVEILAKDAPVVFLRVPDWVAKERVEVDGISAHERLQWKGEYLRLSPLPQGKLVCVSYPLREEKQREIIGGGEFLLSWKGDTVMEISPPGKVYPLYQRSSYRSGQQPPEKTTSHYVPVRGLHW